MRGDAAVCSLAALAEASDAGALLPLAPAAGVFAVRLPVQWRLVCCVADESGIVRADEVDGWQVRTASSASIGGADGAEVSAVSGSNSNCVDG